MFKYLIIKDTYCCKIDDCVLPCWAKMTNKMLNKFMSIIKQCFFNNFLSFNKSLAFIDAKRKVRLNGAVPINLYYWKAENLDFGIAQYDISGFAVRMTDVERSVCDAIKYRNKVGADICAEVVKNYLNRSERNISRLIEYANKLHIKKILNTYLEVLI